MSPEAQKTDLEKITVQHEVQSQLGSDVITVHPVIKFQPVKTMARISLPGMMISSRR